MRHNRPKLFYYRIAQLASLLVAIFIFKRKMLRNEIKGKKGPFVVIANHQAALDFVNLIGSTMRPMSFVISNSFFNTLPIKGFLTKMGVIPKQQFQTTAKDLKQIKAVVEAGEAVVIYPAGLMCEDGLSTPIPSATYKFLKWLGADVYVARTSGTYFVMPKWGRGMRTGRTYLDIYQLFSKEELAELDLDALKEKTDAALLFDAYREQEEHRIPYRKGDHIAGLEHVLYQCPHCKHEFSVQTGDQNTIYCTECGFTEHSDSYGFLHHQGTVGRELRYVSDWSRMIYDSLKKKLLQGEEAVLSQSVKIHMIDYDACKFKEVGGGTVTLSKEGFLLQGRIGAEEVELKTSIANIPSLPFSPGKYFEIQHGSNIYRCLPEDGRLVMKFINMVKIFYELSHMEEDAAHKTKVSAQ